MCSWHEDLRNTWSYVVSRSILLRMRIFSDESCRENQNTHFMISHFIIIIIIIIIIILNRAVYELMWKNIVERVRPQMTI